MTSEERPVIVEVVVFALAEAGTSALDRAFVEASPLLSRASGYISHEFGRCIEDENSYALIVRWRTLEDHTETFRNSPEYASWRSLLVPHIKSDTWMRHFEVKQPADRSTPVSS